MTRTAIAAVLIAALALVAATPKAGAATSPDLSRFAFQPHPGASLPLDAMLSDERGDPVTLADFFGRVPVVLVFEYQRCKTFCGLTLSGLLNTLDTLSLNAGRDYQLVAVSIDPRDTPADNAAAKAKYLQLYHHADGAAGIHFLTGTQPEVRRIADAVGFPYRYDPDADQYAHPAGFVTATPNGRISRYIFGVSSSTAELTSAIAGASRGLAISPLSRLFLLCHVEGLPIGRFTVPVLAAFTIADIVAGIGVIAVFISVRRRLNG